MHTVNPRLQYIDFQILIDSVRQKITRNVTDKELRKKLRISYMVTGEYGELNKRPHWHAILFNYAPPDAKHIRTTDREERVYTSILLSDLWGKGAIEYGSVTIDSAGYVARYAAKKLVHGHDQDHEYHPIHKTSKGRAIGRSWIEKYHEFTFQNGFVVLPNKSCAKIPRYYLDWYKKYYPTEWERYVTEIRTKSISLA